MTACITMRTRKFGAAAGGFRPLLRRLFAIVFLVLLWQLATLFFPPLVVPPVPKVAARLLAIMSSAKFLPTVTTTLLRLLCGLAIGIGLGTTIGLLFGLCRPAEDLFSPLISILQTVPPVCWVVLALVWFGFNGKPCIFIVVTASVPTMVINLAGGVRSIDPQLLEMARLYRFSGWKTLRHIVLPSIRPYFRSALEIVIGGSWKLVVMGEVLTTSSGIGGAITTARLNIEPDAIIAWALLLVIFCFLTQKLLQLLCCRSLSPAEQKGAAGC